MIGMIKYAREAPNIIRKKEWLHYKWLEREMWLERDVLLLLSKYKKQRDKPFYLQCGSAFPAYIHMLIFWEFGHMAYISRPRTHRWQWHQLYKIRPFKSAQTDSSNRATSYTCKFTCAFSHKGNLHKLLNVQYYGTFKYILHKYYCTDFYTTFTNI